MTTLPSDARCVATGTDDDGLPFVLMKDTAGRWWERIGCGDWQLVPNQAAAAAAFDAPLGAEIAEDWRTPPPLP